jgi:RNA polymerase sigma-70 factor (ECF subfamily)
LPESEDVVRETYLRALAALPAFRWEASLATWLTRIAVHEALAQVRRRGRRRGVAVESASGAPSPERLAYDDELRRAIETAIDDLPEPLRLVLVLRAVEGLSSAETAAVLDLSVVTLKVHRWRARLALRRQLGAREIGETGVFEFGGERCRRICETVLARAGCREGHALIACDLCRSAATEATI